MLVLSRKNDQEIVIDEVIRIRVIEIRGNSVRLGITAPADVPIHRDEIHRVIAHKLETCATANEAALT